MEKVEELKDGKIKSVKKGQGVIPSIPKPQVSKIQSPKKPLEMTKKIKTVETKIEKEIIEKKETKQIKNTTDFLKEVNLSKNEQLSVYEKNKTGLLKKIEEITPKELSIVCSVFTPSLLMMSSDPKIKIHHNINNDIYQMISINNYFNRKSWNNFIKQGSNGKVFQKMKEYFMNLASKDLELCAEIFDFPLVQDPPQKIETFKTQVFHTPEKKIYRKSDNFHKLVIKTPEKSLEDKKNELICYYFGKISNYEKSEGDSLKKEFENTHLEDMIIKSVDKRRSEPLNSKNDPWNILLNDTENKDIQEHILLQKKESQYFDINGSILPDALKKMISGNQDKCESLVYHWIHLKSGKSFIGRTEKDLISKTKEHINEAFSKTDGCRELNFLLRRSSPEDWKIFVIQDRVYNKDLEALEKKFIDRYDTLFPKGLNIKN